MDEKHKIIFVQKTFGSLSEVFLYRLLTNISTFHTEVLTESYINQDHFPFDRRAMKFWNYSSVPTFKKIFPLLRKKLKLAGSYSGAHKQIIDQINNSDANLVCFQFAFLPVDMGTDIHKIKKKICIIHHGSDINKAIEDSNYRSRLNELWKKVDKIIFVSHFLKDVALSLGCPEEKVIVNYLGVPDISIKYKKTIDDDIFRFISVARMVPVKNHINLVRAFSKLLNLTERKVELILIGTGALKDEIKNEVRLLGLENHVKMMGGLSNDKVLPNVANADACILISRIHIIKNKTRHEEALGLTLLEGARVGLPLIGSKTGGIPEIIKNDINGYLVDPLDTQEISHAMLNMLEDPNKTKQMGNNAKKLAEKDFAMEKQLKKMEKIFLNIVTTLF